MKIDHTDPRLSWHGHVSLEQTNQYTRPVRIPFEQRGLFPAALLPAAMTQAGIRLAFRSDTDSIQGLIVEYAENQKLDLFVNGTFHQTVDLQGRDQFEFRGLPDGENLLELWLPQRGDFALRELTLNEGASLAPYKDDRPKWITYGSSITHCRSADSPSQTWPAIVAREKQLNLTCLGYGGQCHLDIQIARMMRDLPADYISICAGINIYGRGSLNVRTFVPSLVGFVQLLREKHPRTPLALISPIYGCHRETTPNNVDWTLNDYRRGVEEATEILRAHGDSAVLYVNGLDLFGSDLEKYLPDQLHPDAEGTRKLAANFLTKAAPRFIAATKTE